MFSELNIRLLFCFDACSSTNIGNIICYSITEGISPSSSSSSEPSLSLSHASSSPSDYVSQSSSSLFFLFFLALFFDLSGSPPPTSSVIISSIILLSELMPPFDPATAFALPPDRFPRRLSPLNILLIWSTSVNWDYIIRYQHHLIKEFLEFAEVPSGKQIWEITVEHILINVTEIIIHFSFLGINQD